MDTRGVDCPSCKAPAGTPCIDHASGGYARSEYHAERRLTADAATERAIVAAVSLERDAAISLLLETPVECIVAKMSAVERRCGRCWPCRVDKFLRDAGVRR